MKIAYLDGIRLYRVLYAGIQSLLDEQDYLNKINVFPVPDGDTGTNMAFTLMGIIEHIQPHSRLDLNELSNIVKCPKENEWSYHTYYVYVIETPEGTRNDLKKYLEKQNIETKIHYENSTHLLPYINNKKNLPNTEYTTSNILSLPNYYDLPEHWQQHIIKSIKDFYKKNNYGK